MIQPPLTSNDERDTFDNQQGRVQLIGATVEHEVGMGMVLSAQYVGKLTHGMVSNNLARYNDLPLKYLSLGSLLFANINSPAAQAAGISVPYAGFTGSVAQALRPYPQYQGVAEVNAPDGYSTYHAVLLSASKRFSNGLSFLISDTIGKIVGVTSPYSTGTLSTWQNTIQHGAFLNTAKGVAPWNPGQELLP